MESIRGFSFFFKKTKTSNPLDLEVFLESKPLDLEVFLESKPLDLEVFLESKPLDLEVFPDGHYVVGRVNAIKLRADTQVCPYKIPRTHWL